MSQGHTSELNRFTEYNTADNRTHPDIAIARLETLDSFRPEPEPHVCIYQTKGCTNEKLCFHCQAWLNRPMTAEEREHNAKLGAEFTARADRLNRETPKQLIADKPFWDSLSIRERNYVMRNVPKPVFVLAPVTMGAHEYVWLQKRANEVGGADADQEILAECALVELRRRIAEAEPQKIVEPSKVPGPPVTTELPF